MSKEMDEMGDRVAEFLYDKVYGRIGCGGLDWKCLWNGNDLKYKCHKQANEILSLETDTCRIAVVRKEAELPNNPFYQPNKRYQSAKWEIHQLAMQSMWNTGWVQEAKDAQ